MIAKFVCDNNSMNPIIPEEMGTPAPDQMLGTPAEQLVELSGRVCYDSLNAPKSRPSDQFHPHLVNVKHFSVHEHVHFTAEVPALKATTPSMTICTQTSRLRLRQSRSFGFMNFPACLTMRLFLLRIIGALISPYRPEKNTRRPPHNSWSSPQPCSKPSLSAGTGNYAHERPQTTRTRLTREPEGIRSCVSQSSGVEWVQ
jgi:hypothetical protein